ncbi:MAG: MBL fold metallo-hydrolase [Candidatus Hydrogenedentes bacterium]|nr:MBL fold metallo-hydrolase [Candidatus Hydrogenedentota bacterium]
MKSHNSINFSVLGGGGEVGANCFQLSCNGYRILLDCGTHPKKDGLECLPSLDLINRPPDAYFVSHGHVDHCGALPYLCKQFAGLRGYTTVPSASIIERMLHNSVVVMEMLAKERGIEGYPLFDHYDVGYTMRFLETRKFNEPFSFCEGFDAQAEFIPAGHVLGSTSILLRLPGHTILYTGDISQTRQYLIGGCASPGKDIKIDTLIIESTLGATNDENNGTYDDEIHRLATAIRNVLNGGGCALIPSFALGRTQEIVNIIAQLQEEGELPFTPIYTVGLGRAVYEIYNKFSEYLHPEATFRPLSRFERLGNVWDQSVVQNLLRRPSVIVATSGMMTQNTPSALLAETMVKSSHHGIFFVGYLDPDTLGYKLLNATPGTALQFESSHPPVEVTLENIAQYRFSAHASRSQLASVIQQIKPKNIIYVHGDPDALDWMQENTNNGATTFAPVAGQTVTIEI